jgi:hypothetical protein
LLVSNWDATPPREIAGFGEGLVGRLVLVDFEPAHFREGWLLAGKVATKGHPIKSLTSPHDAVTS